jgi:hypothetical protein
VRHARTASRGFVLNRSPGEFDAASSEPLVHSGAERSTLRALRLTGNRGTKYKPPVQRH